MKTNENKIQTAADALRDLSPADRYAAHVRAQSEPEDEEDKKDQGGGAEDPNRDKDKDLARGKRSADESDPEDDEEEKQPESGAALRQLRMLAKDRSRRTGEFHAAAMKQVLREHPKLYREYLRENGQL